MKPTDARVVYIDGKRTTIREYAANAGITPEALRCRMKRRTPMLSDDGIETWSSVDLLTDAREAAAQIVGANKRDDAKRARIMELRAARKPDGSRYTVLDIAADVGVSRTRVYQLMGR